MCCLAQRTGEAKATKALVLDNLLGQRISEKTTLRVAEDYYDCDRMDQGGERGAAECWFRNELNEMKLKYKLLQYKISDKSYQDSMEI